MGLAAIHALGSIRTALPSGRLGATTVSDGPAQPDSETTVQCAAGTGPRPLRGLTPRLKASESLWVLRAGAADILRAV